MSSLFNVAEIIKNYVIKFIISVEFSLGCMLKLQNFNDSKDSSGTQPK